MLLTFCSDAERLHQRCIHSTSRTTNAEKMKDSVFFSITGSKRYEW